MTIYFCVGTEHRAALRRATRGTERVTFRAERGVATVATAAAERKLWLRSGCLPTVYARDHSPHAEACGEWL